MKRIGLLLFILLMIPCMAMAETLGERLQAPERVPERSFSTATKKSTFVINAIVDVPAIDYQPIKLYEVGLRSFSESEIETIAAAMGLDPSAITVEMYEPLTQFQSYLTIYSIHNDQVMFTARNELHNTSKLPTASFLTYSTIQNKHMYTIGAMSAPLEIGNADSQAFIKTAAEVAEKIAYQIAPDLSINHIGVITSEPLISAADTKNPNGKSPYDPQSLPTALRFDFSRTFDGIPVTYTKEGGMGSVENSEPYTEYFYSYESLGLAITDEGLVCADFFSPYEVKGVWKEDGGELLPFSQILKIAESILPLKYASKELSILELAEYEIDRITFGYTRVMMPNQPDRCIMVPAWDFFGTQLLIYNDGKQLNDLSEGRFAGDASDTKSLITINAIDGTVIDRYMGY